MESRTTKKKKDLVKDLGVYTCISLYIETRGNIFTLEQEEIRFSWWIRFPRRTWVGKMAKWFSTRLYLVTSSRCYAYNSELVPVVEGLYAAWRGCNDFDETTG